MIDQNNPKDRFDLYGRKQNWLCISVRKARRMHAGFVCALTAGHVSQQRMAWSLVIAGCWWGRPVMAVCLGRGEVGVCGAKGPRRHADGVLTPAPRADAVRGIS